MKEQLEAIRTRALAELGDGASAEQIENVRVAVLGRSGELTTIMRGMRDVPAAERPAIGQLINEIKRELESRIEALQERGKRAAMEQALAQERLDVTLPGHPHRARPAPSADPGRRRNDRRVRGDGFRGGRDPGRRRRLPQLLRPELSARPSRARDAGHLLPARRDAAADPYFQRPNPRDAASPSPRWP